eukprot:2567875-Rhodomonas_salina.3
MAMPMPMTTRILVVDDDGSDVGVVGDVVCVLVSVSAPLDCGQGFLDTDTSFEGVGRRESGRGFSRSIGAVRYPNSKPLPVPTVPDARPKTLTYTNVA